MKRKAFDRIIAWVLAFGIVFSAMSYVSFTYSGAQVELWQVSAKYINNTHVVSFPVDRAPLSVEAQWHDENGRQQGPSAVDYKYSGGTVTITFPDQTFGKDHIYDITIKVTTDRSTVTVSFLYLAGITFTGESFGVMARSDSIVDAGWKIEDQYIVSGSNPRIKLTWNVPTIYVDNEGVVEITQLLENDTLKSLLKVDIEQILFPIEMTEGRGTSGSYTSRVIFTSENDYSARDQYGSAPADLKYYEENGRHKFTMTLDNTNNRIQPGTEYENVRIRLSFQRDGREITLPSVLKTGSYDFSVRNEDFRKLGIQFDRTTSIYTPVEFRIKKVDEDLILVEFDEIKKGNYPELFYQVKYDPNLNVIYQEIDKWPRIKWVDPYSQKVREIIPYRADDYIAVVFYPNKDSNKPLGASLGLMASFLDQIAAEAPAPLPKNIEISAVNMGEKEITVTDTGGAQEQDRLLISGLNISFDAPQAWIQLRNEGRWEAFKAAGYGEYQHPSFDSDEIEYTFHILVSSYRPDADVEDGETGTVGKKNLQIYMPVKQKRVLVIGKKNLTWDPKNPDRLVVDMDPDKDGLQPIPGDRLFWDYTAIKDGENPDISFENNVDMNQDGKGDYPGFLVPNTIYYVQIFTARYKDNKEINQDVWADGISDSLSVRLSYRSPVLSFTTYPLDRKPVPVPSIKDIEEQLDADDSSGGVELTGVWLKMNRILTRTDWQRYTTQLEDRILEYVIHVSQSPSFDKEYVIREKFDFDEGNFPELDPIPIFISSQEANLKPNTTYYFKTMVNLYAPYEDGEDKPANPHPYGKLVAWSDYSPIKAFTTSKIRPVDVDDSDRKPSAPTDFAIAKDENGKERVTDAEVYLTWSHRESDVFYELICTMDGDPENYADDEYNLRFVEIYKKLADTNTGVIVIDPSDPDGTLAGLGFSIDENNRIIMPIGQGFLKPNKIYFFSLRAVRRDGKGQPSEWITLPVTTSLVKSPEFFEAVRDLEVGFTVECDIPGSDADSMEVYMKKASQPDSAYRKLLRNQYTVVKDKNTYYFRIYNLEPDTLYHFRLYNRTGKEWYVYDDYGGYWSDSKKNPIPAKTRDTYHEIEVRWVGEDLYEYFLEIRSERETLYSELTPLTDYWYDLPDGSKIELYREKTEAFVRDGAVNKYVYYARIARRPVVDSRGVETHRQLQTNTLYYVRLWARNKAEDRDGESLKVGPVSVRTDFNQDDYDRDRNRDNLEDVYNMEADQLLRKLYWLVDSRSATKLRVLLKGDMVSGMLQASPGMTLTVDLSGEISGAESYEILVPQKIVETIEANDSRLNLKIAGAEITINRGSIDAGDLKLQTLGSGSKEAMLCLTVQRKSKSDRALPGDVSLVSRIYDLKVYAAGSRYTYAEISNMIYDILENPDATGPFKYGIFDREMSKLLDQLERYSYRSHTELKDMIKTVMKSIETELSWYLKDILDGGSGLSAGILVNKTINSFPGRIGFKIEYSSGNGLILPYVNYHASQGWKEVSGARGYVMQYLLFRADAPGEYAIVSKSSVTVSPGGSYEGAIGVIGTKYDLTKVFGKTTIYPGDPMTGQQAVMLYAVLTGRDNELVGLTLNQKAARLGIGDILGVKELAGYIDNQSSLSLAVRLYCDKLGIPHEMLQPSRTILISNASQISSRLYRYVAVGIDLGFASLKNSQFDATGRSTVGQVLDMVFKVLEKVGEI